MNDLIRDGDTGSNSFGTPNYYTYDVFRDGNYQFLDLGTIQGYVGWVIRSNPTYYFDEYDIYYITPNTYVQISSTNLPANIYDPDFNLLGATSSSPSMLSPGNYFIEFKSNSPETYSLNIDNNFEQIFPISINNQTLNLNIYNNEKEYIFLAQQNHEVVITLSGSASTLTMDVKDKNNNIINGENFEGSNQDQFIFNTGSSDPYT